MNSKSVAYRAAWIVPIDRPPIRNGVVRVANGLIQSIETGSSSAPDEIDLGEALLLPGLVNAHTHLEFSDLEKPLGQPGMAFTDWIELVVCHRQKMAEREDWPDSKSLAIAKGLNESAAAGVSLIGEVSTQPVCATAYDNSEVEVVAFLERLGRDDSQLEDKLQSLETDSAAFRQQFIQVGISPHAPYSVSDRLFDGLLACAASKHLPIAMHLAESEAELSLLKKGTGAFKELLKKLNAWFPDSYAKKLRPLDYLQQLAKMKSSLLIHGNFFTADELDFVAQHRGRMTPVFCPRTHQYFAHRRYPLVAMLDRGIDVAVGTDSRASNPNLCVLSELKTIHGMFPEVSVETIVAMGTINGATALGLAGSYGSLTPGKNAALCRVEVDRTVASDDVYAAILSGSPKLLI